MTDKFPPAMQRPIGHKRRNFRRRTLLATPVADASIFAVLAPAVAFLRCF